MSKFKDLNVNLRGHYSIIHFKFHFNCCHIRTHSFSAVGSVRVATMLFSDTPNDQMCTYVRHIFFAVRKTACGNSTINYIEYFCHQYKYLCIQYQSIFYAMYVQITTAQKRNTRPASGVWSIQFDLVSVSIRFVSHSVAALQISHYIPDVYGINMVNRPMWCGANSSQWNEKS